MVEGRNYMMCPKVAGEEGAWNEVNLIMDPKCLRGWPMGEGRDDGA